MLTKKENYIRASLTVATRMDEHQLFSPTHGSPKFLWLFANNRKFPGMRFHCSKLGNIRWAAHFSLDCFGKWLKEKKQINHLANILIMLAFSHLLTDVLFYVALNFMISTRLEWSGWTKAWDKESATGAGWNNNAATDINVHVRHEQVWQHSKPSTYFFQASNTQNQGEPNKVAREQGKRLAFTILLHLPNGPISRKRMEANGWWR